MSRVSTWLPALLLVCLVLSPAASRAASQATSQGAPPPATEDGQERDWQVLFSVHQESLVQQAGRVKALALALPKQVKAFRSDLGGLEAKLDEIGFIISLSGGNPWELRAVLNDLGRLRRNAETVTAPFRANREELQKIAARLDSLKDEFAKRTEENPEPDIAEAINYSLRYIVGVKASLSGVAAALDKELGPAKDLTAELDKTEASLRDKLPKAWKSYFFTASPELFSVSAWTEFGTRFSLWKRSLAMFRSLVKGSDAQRATAAGAKAAVGLILLLAADLLLARHIRSRYPGLKALPRLRQAWRLDGLGVLLHWVSLGAPLILYELLNAATEILLAAGLAVFSRSMAQASRAVEEAGDNPLRRLLAMFALGLILQIADIPEPALTAVWMACLAVFFLASRRADRSGAGPLGPIDRVTPFLAAGLIALSALGWQHLAVLVLSGWFLFLAAVQIGLCGSRMVNDWQARAEAEGHSAAMRGLVSGLGFPLIFLSLFFLVLYWFSTEIGGQEVFLEAVAFQVGIGEASVTLGRLIAILTGFFLTRSALVAVRAFIRDLPKLKPGLDAGVRDVLDTTALYLLWGVYALASLFLLGFSFTSLAVVAGGLSVGIGFGLQNIVNNFVAGLILLFGRSIQAGDTIQIDSTWGQVKKVNIRNTVVQTFDNATLFVPNSDLVTGKLINWSHRDKTVRREISVGVAYGSDTEKVRRILLTAASSHPRVLATPAPSVQFLNFGESSLDFKLFFWVDDVAAGMSTTSDIRFAIDKCFREEGIEIPFPQREVRIREGGPAAACGGVD